MPEPAAGVLLYPKPTEVTSHDIVARVRRTLPRKSKVGHAGTLDPFASGLLLVLVGRATRAQRFLMALPKTYRAVARLGWRSDTGDRDGTLEQTGRMPTRLELPTGELMQTPPAYSAVKVDGQRAYALARRGETPQLQPRPVTVYRAQLLWHEGDRAGFEIECSSGTYVRSLIEELGDAYCDELERTAIGSFRLEDADEQRVVPLAEALRFLPERPLSDEEAQAIRHGRCIPLERTDSPLGAAPARARRRPQRGDSASHPRRRAAGGRRAARDDPATRRSVRARMKITPLPEVVSTGSRRRVAIGTFDGVHLGHREVIRGSDTVLTFDPHPATVVAPDRTPKLLNPFAVKRDLIAGLGVDELVVIPFDREFASKDAEHFVNEVLMGTLEAERVSVGQNFHFGKGARGNADFLAQHDEFETRVVPLVEVGASPSPRRASARWSRPATSPAPRTCWAVRSCSRARSSAATGAVASSACRPPTSCPTPALDCPAHGVYAAWAHGHPAAVNVGVRPTFETGRGLLVEAHLLDFDGDLYGERLRIAFLERLRGEERFESVDALVAQMRLDVERTREICSRIRFDPASS